MPNSEDNFEDEPLYIQFLDWCSEIAQHRGELFTVGELLGIVKSIVMQLRMSMTPEEISLAFSHAVAFTESWLRENDYMVQNLTTNQPERLQTAEEVRFGKNALSEVQPGWVPDNLPEWLTEDEQE